MKEGATKMVEITEAESTAEQRMGIDLLWFLLLSIAALWMKGIEDTLPSNDYCAMLVGLSDTNLAVMLGPTIAITIQSDAILAMNWQYV